MLLAQGEKNILNAMHKTAVNLFYESFMCAG